MMRIEWKDFKVNGKKINARVSIKEKGDRKLIKDLYHDWKKLNDRLKAIGTRGINLPETISENAFCLFFTDCVRTVGLKKVNALLIVSTLKQAQEYKLRLQV